MSLPVDNTVIMPSAVRPYGNGALPASVLVVTPKFNQGPDLVLCEMASRAFRAYAGACQAATGVALRTSGKADSYRPRAVQDAIFRTRYTTDGPTAVDRVGIFYAGQRWYRRPGVAQAAKPGTSNHGMGIAVDWANYAQAITWMIAHAAEYGISWELQSESWHQRYNDGDRLPVAVLKWEAQQQMAINEADFNALIWRVKALIDDSPTVSAQAPINPGEVNGQHKHNVRVENALAELATAIGDVKVSLAALHVKVDVLTPPA